MALRDPRSFIHVIETYYNGYRFRSRLEARWAVFLDALDMGFRYEPEGYVINGEPYLPDFYLPTLNAFLEIKPVMPAYLSREDCVARGLAEGTDTTVYVLSGQPSDPGWHRGEFAEATAYFPDGGDDWPYFWCECRFCGLIGLQFEGRSARLPCGCQPGNDRDHNSGSERLLRAYDAARCQRFEHRQ